MFADSNQGMLPRTTHDSPVKQSWIYTLMPYLENPGQIATKPGDPGARIDKVRICPADPRGPDRLRQTLPGNLSSSYVLNEYTAVKGIDESRNLHKMPATTRTILVFTGSDHLSLSVYSDHTHSRNWFKARPETAAEKEARWTRITNDIQVDRFGGEKFGSHLAGLSNYLFADGHVEAIPAATLRQRSDTLDNFAKPAE
jgi:prepilin-type processing-associated H-X9-DG protein